MTDWKQKIEALIAKEKMGADYAEYDDIRQFHREQQKILQALLDEFERLKAELEKEKRMTKTALRMPFMQSTPRGWKFIPEDEDEK